MPVGQRKSSAAKTKKVMVRRKNGPVNVVSYIFHGEHKDDAGFPARLPPYMQVGIYSEPSKFNLVSVTFIIKIWSQFLSGFALGTDGPTGT